ncbi:transporter [Pelagivirga sediminicola]|uniref:Transporter n=1 Tax=Pelagivirga sediminicola TaxID=2170575 RepID=A0A2T7GAU4_9RHOB|nr:transporter [Pelagivirga sediminicola]
MSAVDADEYLTIAKKDLEGNHEVHDLFPGSAARMALVSESGLYKFVLRSQRTRPAAKEFQDWVTKVVLPAIRKDGLYVQGEEHGALAEK